MKRLALLLLPLFLLTLPAATGAQTVELPEYTEEQRWERLTQLMLGWEAAVVALGKEHGMTPEETGEFVGEFFTAGWLGGADARWFLRAMHRNFMALPEAEVEVLEQTPLSVTARFNRPLDDFRGPGDETMGIAGEEIDAMLHAVDDAVAEYVGIDLERRRDGEHDVISLTTEYGPVVASDDIRWARGSYLHWLTWLQLMSLRKEAGMTAAEIGAANAELYASSWTARTPWQLYRGMVWNQLSDPNTECEVISASPREVRARCVQHYRELVEQNQSRFNVTPDDVFEGDRAFAMGIADHLGLQWSETLEDGYRLIVVTRK